jgi:hypothetical protein
MQSRLSVPGTVLRTTTTVIGAIPFADALDTTTATLDPGDPSLPSGCVFGVRSAENGV